MIILTISLIILTLISSFVLILILTHHVSRARNRSRRGVQRFSSSSRRCSRRSRCTLLLSLLLQLAFLVCLLALHFPPPLLLLLLCFTLLCVCVCVCQCTWVCGYVSVYIRVCVFCVKPLDTLSDILSPSCCFDVLPFDHCCFCFCLSFKCI